MKAPKFDCNNGQKGDRRPQEYFKMRRGLMLASLLLPLTGCYVQPGVGYGYGGYQQPGYQAAPYGYQEDAYPGYDYNGGSPHMAYEGSQMPLIFFGGLWGFNDRYGNFHRAPDGVQRHLESRHPQGSGARAFGGQSAAPHFGGGQQQFAPPAHQGWQGGGGGQPRVEHRQAPVAPAAAAPAPRAAAAPAPRQEEHRGGDRHCPNGQTHC